MKNKSRAGPTPVASEPHGPLRWLWLIAAGCVVLILLGTHRRSQSGSSTDSEQNAVGASKSSSEVRTRNHLDTRRVTRQTEGASVIPAEEVVAGKVGQFGRSRRDIIRRIAQRSNKQAPAEIEEFFDAIETGDWDLIDSKWKGLANQSGQYEHGQHSAEFDPYWSAVLDAYGVAEQAHLWPAQKLLDYGNSILGALRPGMVYVGGTDCGRWIPELLNDTSDGERHIIVTQNGMADGRYQDYMSELYGDQLSTISKEDSQRAFQDYLYDAQKRMQHDQKFPDEPKQLRPGEDVQVVDNRVQVSGQVAVMAINERLLTMLMGKNPGVSFAIQESFPLQGTYADALPLGPLMELRAQDAQTAFTPERATESLGYWRDASQQILSDSQAAGNEEVLKSYSHDADATANLLAAHGFDSEAEQTYRLALQLCPWSPEAANKLAELLTRTGRAAEADQFLADFSRKYPSSQKDLEAMSAVWKFRASGQAGKL